MKLLVRMQIYKIKSMCSLPATFSWKLHQSLDPNMNQWDEFQRWDASECSCHLDIKRKNPPKSHILVIMSSWPQGVVLHCRSSSGPTRTSVSSSASLITFLPSEVGIFVDANRIFNSICKLINDMDVVIDQRLNWSSCINAVLIKAGDSAASGSPCNIPKHFHSLAVTNPEA